MEKECVNVEIGKDVFSYRIGEDKKLLYDNIHRF